jgi:hypothetical protein
LLQKNLHLLIDPLHLTAHMRRRKAPWKRGDIARNRQIGMEKPQPSTGSKSPLLFAGGGWGRGKAIKSA